MPPRFWFASTKPERTLRRAKAPTSRSSRTPGTWPAGGGPRRDLRPVHRRGPGARRRLGSRPGGRQVRRERARRARRGRAADAAAGQPAGEDARQRFTFYFRPATARSRPTAPIADVRPDRAEIWSPLKTPIGAQEQIALEPRPAGHKRQGARDPGRRLVRPAPVLRRRLRGGRGLQGDGQAGQADVAPHRRASARAGSTRWHLARAGAYLGRQRARLRAAPHQRGDRLGHGLGEMLGADARDLPAVGNLGFAQIFFSADRERALRLRRRHAAAQRGPTRRFNTGSMRNVYSPTWTTAAGAGGRPARQGDGARTRTSSARASRRDERMRAVLDKVAEVGDWGRRCRPAPPRASAIHASTRGQRLPGRDRLPPRDRQPAGARRVHRAPGDQGDVFAVDVGLPVNPRGLEAQMMGGIMDGIGQTLTCSLHLQDGTSSRPAGTTTSTPASGTRRPRSR